jgi:RNA polymerase sigma-70 factor (ECF subfamily)
MIDGRPGVLARDPCDPSTRPIYFVILEWTGNRVVNIRDFRYARYAIECAEVVTLP